MKKSVISLTLVVTVFLICSISAQSEFDSKKDYNGDSVVDQKDQIYWYGANFNEFSKKSYLEQVSIIRNKDRFEVFMQGLDSSFKEDFSGNEGFLDAWVKKREDGRGQLDDEVKNKLWKAFSKEQRSVVARDFAKKKFEEMKEKNPGFFKDPSAVQLEEVNLDSENLEWKGNKLVRVENGEEVAWVDFDNLPRWTKKIEFFEEGKYGKNYFSFEYDTGRARKTVIAHKGSIGPMGEVIAPDGKRVGTRFSEGLQSLRLEGNKVIAEYNLDGDKKTIALGESDIDPLVFNSLQKILEKKKIGDGISGEEMRTKLNEVFGEIDGLGIESPSDFVDPELGLPTNNQVNVMYGGDYDNHEVIQINFDEKNELTVKGTHGAMVVTTDSKGNIDLIARQFYSKDGIVDKRFDSKEYLDMYPQLDDEAGVFVFDRNGGIKSAKNAKITLVAGDSYFSDVYTSRGEFVGVDVVRNSLVDAIARGDISRVVELVAGKDNLLDRALSGENVDVKMELMNMLKAQLSDEDLKTDLRIKLQNAFDTTVRNLESSSENLIDYFLTRGRGDFTPEENRIREHVIEMTKSETKDTLNSLLSDEQSVHDLLSGDPEKVEKVMKEALKRGLESDNLRVLFNSEVAGQINDALQAGKKGDISEYLADPQKLEELIDKADIDIEAAVKRRLEGVTPRQILYERIEASLKEKVKDADERGKTLRVVDSFLVEIEKKLEAEKALFRKRVAAEMRESYSTTVKVDMDAKEVTYIGDKYVLVDAKTPLNRVGVTSTREKGDDPGDLFKLYSNGKIVAAFDGKQTKVYRTVRNHNYRSIDRIVNERTGSTLKLARKSYGYTLYDPYRLVSKGHYITGGFIRANPIVGATITKPLEGDIATQAGSRITLWDATDQITGIFGGKIKRGVVQKKLPHGFPVGPMSDRVRKEADAQVQKIIADAGGPEKFKERLTNLDKTLDDYKVTLPPKASDLLYAGLYREGVDQMFDFMKRTAYYSRGNYLVITPTYVSVNGKKMTQFRSKSGEKKSIAPIARTYMRMFDETASDPRKTPFRHYHPSEAKGMM